MKFTIVLIRIDSLFQRNLKITRVKRIGKANVARLCSTNTRVAVYCRQMDAHMYVQKNDKPTDDHYTCYFMTTCFRSDWVPGDILYRYHTCSARSRYAQNFTINTMLFEWAYFVGSIYCLRSILWFYSAIYYPTVYIRSNCLFFAISWVTELLTSQYFWHLTGTIPWHVFPLRC